MLKMKPHCEACSNDLPPTSEAYICSYECTFCESCTDSMSKVCPNCQGELVKRPKRTRGVVDVATSQIKKKLFGKD